VNLADPDSSPDNVIKRIIRNTRKSQERMQKALCQKLAHSIQQSIQREETKETNQTAQVRKRPTQINTSNSTKAAVPQTQTPAVLKDESKDSSSGDIESIKRSNKRTHRRLRSDRRYSQDKTSVNNSKGQTTETLQM
jgi:hypothetical protein